ncbi:MAG: hypothetical protein IJH34_04295, partial [Romboutsia sp.]|nr:hypothetical protein [Romboutsia sp.]
RKSFKIYDKIKKGGRYDIKMYKKGEETEEILKQIFDISSNSFKDKPFYTDIPFDLFKGIYMEWMKEIDYKLFTCVDKQNTIIGYALCYENPFDNKNFIIKTTAFKKDNTNKLLPVACRYMGHQYAIEKGYETALYHYQYVENKVSIKMTSKESKKIREYGVFTYSM